MRFCPKAALAGLDQALWDIAGKFYGVPTYKLLGGAVRPRLPVYASLLRYGIARWARVYPVYFLSLLVLAPIIFNDLVLFPQGRPPGLRLSLLLNYGLVLQGWTGHMPVQWNTPAWSLSCELFFYLCFPLALLLLRSAGRRGTLVIAGAGLALPVLCRVLHVPDAAKPLLHLGDFLIGIACAGAGSGAAGVSTLGGLRNGIIYQVWIQCRYTSHTRCTGQRDD